MGSEDSLRADARGAPSLVIARNPSAGTRLPYLLYVPVAGEEPLLLATSDVWPQTSDLFCYELKPQEWPEEPEVLDSAPIQACWRLGKAVHLVLKRRSRRRSMFIWTQSRGAKPRTLVFWRTRKTMQAARPGIRVPAARGLERRAVSIAVDCHERYAWKFPRQHANTERRALPAGDYGIFFGDRLVAAVERKSMTDLLTTMSSGALRLQLAELSRLPRAILVVEGRPRDLLQAEKEAGVSRGWILNLMAALQVEYPNVQWLFAETRRMAQDMAYRWLSAAVVVLRQTFSVPVPEGSEAHNDGGGEATLAGSPSRHPSGASGAAQTGGGGAASTASAVAEGRARWGAGGQHPVQLDAAYYKSPRGLADGPGNTTLRGSLAGQAVAGEAVTDRAGRQREALALASQGRVWTARNYQEYFQVSFVTAYRDLGELVQKGSLALGGPGRPRRLIYPKAESTGDPEDGA